MRCATHPKVETNLECGKCGKPVCPKCMIQTPVGIRCLQCAKLKSLPTYAVSPRHYLKAAGVGIGLAIGTGIAWWIIQIMVPFFYLDFLLAAGVGYVIGELISLSVNRKRGRGLQAIAGGCVLLSYAVNHLFLSFFHLFSLLALVIGILVAISRLR